MKKLLILLTILFCNSFGDTLELKKDSILITRQIKTQENLVKISEQNLKEQKEINESLKRFSEDYHDNTITFRILLGISIVAFIYNSK